MSDEDNEKREQVGDQITDGREVLRNRTTIPTGLIAESVALGRGQDTTVLDAMGAPRLDFSHGNNLLGHADFAITHAIKSQMDVFVQAGPLGTSIMRIQIEYIKRLTQLLLEETRLEDPVCHFTASPEEALRILLDLHPDSLVGIVEGQKTPPGMAGRVTRLSRDTEVMRQQISFDHQVGLLVVEPVHLDGYALPAEYLFLLNKWAKRGNAIVIVDESESGLYRCDGMLAQTVHENLTSDYTVLAGGGGLPLGSIVGERAAMASLVVTQGTFALHPLAAAAGLVTLGAMDQNLRDVVRVRGEKMALELESLVEQHPEHLLSTQGFGLLWGLDFTTPEVAAQVRRMAWVGGVWVAHPPGNPCSLSLMPSLAITDDEIHMAVDALHNALELVV